MGAYGLGSMAGDLTSGFRESQKENREEERYQTEKGFKTGQADRAERTLGMAETSQDLSLEERRAQLERVRGQARGEGMIEATKLLLAGRLKDAETAWNAKGNQRIKPGSLQYDQKSGTVKWTEADGTQGEAKDRMLAAIAGVKWSEATGSSGKTPAAIQEIEFYAKKITGGDYKKAILLKRMATENPGVAYSKALSDLRSANEEAFSDEKKTEEELKKLAKESVDYFRDARLEELFGKDKNAPTQQQRGLPEDMSKGTINRTPQGKDPLGIL